MAISVQNTGGGTGPPLKGGYPQEVEGIPYWFSDVHQENYEAIKKGNASVLRLSRARMAQRRERKKESVLRWKGGGLRR